MIAAIGRSISSFMISSWLTTNQLTTVPVDWWLSRRIGLKVSMPSDLYVPPGTLVLANHRSRLDPFLVTFHLGAQNWYSALPVRYPMAPEYARSLVLGPFLKTLGAYDIGQTSMERAKKLLFTRDLLDRKRTVLLFPEGRLVKDGVVVEAFQEGAKMLFHHDYPTLFVHLSGFDTGTFLHPKTAKNPQMRYSKVIRGTAEEKLAYMGEFFSEGETV